MSAIGEARYFRRVVRELEKKLKTETDPEERKKLEAKIDEYKFDADCAWSAARYD